MPFVLLLALLCAAFAQTTWQQPPRPILDVLHAPDLPRVWTSPDAAWLLLAQAVRYPPLEDRAAPMLTLAGERVDPRTNGFFGQAGSVAPSLMHVEDGTNVPIALPDDARLLDVTWTADGRRYALTVRRADRIALWVGEVPGPPKEVPELRLDPLLGQAVTWMPDQRTLLVKRVPARGEPPAPPAIPPGPTTFEGAGGAPRSTYEARNLLRSAHDEALFVYYATSEIVRVDPAGGTVRAIGQPDIYAGVSASPDGRYLLVERLAPPWSRETGWWRFAHRVDVWTVEGVPVATVAALPLADHVPIQGVPEGARDVSWRATADASLVWVEALDGGDPGAKVPHRDRLLRLDAPFAGPPVELFRAAHRIRGWYWSPRGGTLLLEQYERERRWRHVWILDADRKTARAWFDLSDKDRYADPGDPVMTRLPNGRWVLRQEGDDVWFEGPGATPGGDRPFLDRRSLRTGAVERVFRSASDVYESFVAFAGTGVSRLLVRRESPTEVPNYHLVSLGGRLKSAPAGEAARARTERAVTAFPDPTPQLRDVKKRIVTYTRADGVPLSFTLYLPPGYQEGTRLPTVLYAYPLEYSDPATAGQVSGSERTFTRIGGASHLFFLLSGYAVLHNTTMPVLGDPDTVYDTFVEQLVADAEAAVTKAVELGVADPDRIGIMGHSHGALMTATLLAHSDLFRAGIARSGAYNHTIRPFGFQSERRMLWDARDTYLGLSPVMFAPEIDEPLLLVHGEIDENPGTVPLQSERLFDAVRGTGGTVRLLMLPYEGHGYQAKESIEHVLWEQLGWFDRYVKGAEGR